MEGERLRSIVESLLFAAGEPLALSRIEKIATGYERREIMRVLGALAEEYEQGGRGFRLAQVAGGWQLRTPRENADFIRELRAERPVRLTRASLETLAIVAYRQPVTRPEIEAIRGVDVDAVLATLLERRLIRVLGRKDVIGRPLLYGTTPDFLEIFGLKDLSSLPTLEELGASVEALERAAASAIEVESGDATAANEPELPGIVETPAEPETAPDVETPPDGER